MSVALNRAARPLRRRRRRFRRRPGLAEVFPEEA
jgi:hypothetical protein